MQTPHSSELDKVLAKTIKTMLKPLVKLLLSRGITYPNLLEPLKQIFVEVAEESFALENKRQTDSRVSLITGVHRKEVKRLREMISNTQSLPEIKAGLSAQIMSEWTGNDDFLSKSGQPLPLTKQGKKHSFEALVFTVSKDKHPRSVLDDWLNQGIVSINEEGLICLNEAGFVPTEDETEKLFFAGKNIGNHLSVVTNNLDKTQPAMFDRAVYYRYLSPESLHTVETIAKEKSLALLSEINHLAHELQQKDENNTSAVSQFHFGSYFYRDEENHEK
ncbi:DUF6502 family protein [Hydrogenovibrio sp. 3SP14C1]|uniref:DUF6502 family protein n=1 Tax=Hydrogenovibrio sp. 3SP14C1 TaxID=3038774 RepID=UPI002415E6A0|nr:DUF6502 family protein [Hydrogenovibrio sp. 3SP14C1]MDG4812363.1 DUF6502 family protein [Hydrogenovibrio sp. 3SP14C1]